MNASPMVAARAVDGKSDQDIRLKTCRAIMREAVKRCAEIGMGAVVEGVEEIEFGDRAQIALLDYLKARSEHEAGRRYIGVTRGMDEIAARASEQIADQDEQKAAA